MALYEIEIRALGRFDPTPDLVAELGELLEGATGLVDPVVSADLAAGAVELSVEVEAPDRKRAHLTAAEALGAAMVEAGPIAAWSVISPGEIAIVEPGAGGYGGLPTTGAEGWLSRPERPSAVTT